MNFSVWLGVRKYLNDIPILASFGENGQSQQPDRRGMAAQRRCALRRVEPRGSDREYLGPQLTHILYVCLCHLSVSICAP